MKGLTGHHSHAPKNRHLSNPSPISAQRSHRGSHRHQEERVNRHPKEPRLQGKPALKVALRKLGRHVGSGGEREVQAEVTGAKVRRQERPRNMASPGRKRPQGLGSRVCECVWTCKMWLWETKLCPRSQALSTYCVLVERDWQPTIKCLHGSA